MNINQAAKFWLGKFLLPITPNDFEIKNNNQNESKSSVDGTPITVAKRDKAQTFTFSFLFFYGATNYVDPFVSETAAEIPQNYKELTDYLWVLKWEKMPVNLVIEYTDGTSIAGEFLLDDYSYKQDATNGSDYEFSLTLTEYYPALNYEVNSMLRNSLIEQGIRNPRRLD